MGLENRLSTAGYINAVSYTHLDVYKRQGDLQAPRRAADPADDIVFLQPGFAGAGITEDQADLSFAGAAGFEDLAGLGIRAGIEVGRARQRGQAPGLDLSLIHI